MKNHYKSAIDVIELAEDNFYEITGLVLVYYVGAKGAAKRLLDAEPDITMEEIEKVRKAVGLRLEDDKHVDKMTIRDRRSRVYVRRANNAIKTYEFYLERLESSMRCVKPLTIVDDFMHFGYSKAVTLRRLNMLCDTSKWVNPENIDELNEMKNHYERITV